MGHFSQFLTPQTPYVLIDRRRLYDDAYSISQSVFSIASTPDIRRKHIVQPNSNNENKMMTLNNRTAHAHKVFHDDNHCSSLLNPCASSLTLMQPCNIWLSEILFFIFFYVYFCLFCPNVFWLWNHASLDPRRTRGRSVVPDVCWDFSEPTDLTYV